MAILSADRRERLTLRVEEELRRYSRGATRRIALHRGRRLGMWIGCGFPKSGTTWLCELMGTSLGLPVPIQYQSPIMMKSVLHAHWYYDPRLPPTVYLRRDGRDVVVSTYFFWTRLATKQNNPKVQRKLAQIFGRLYGPSFDPDDIRANLPAFIEYEMTEAPAVRKNWAQHLEDWADRPNVGYVRYEDLLVAPAETLAPALELAGGMPVDLEVVRLAEQRYTFARAAGGRQAGKESRASFRRKGVAGDWRQHFTREAGEVFDAYAGDALVEFGYAANRGWYESL